MATKTALPQYLVAASTPTSRGSRDCDEEKESRFWPSKWKRGLWWDFAMTFVIFCAHVAFLLGAQLLRKEPGAGFWGSYGFAIFSKKTDCNQLEHERTGWSMVVNILAALISIFSSSTLQALSAPTRTQLDICHRKGDYLEIGVQSFHNIIKPYVGWMKRILWVLLMLMSIPFHLLYNSVIVLSIPATESYQVTLSDTFFHLDRHINDALPAMLSSTGTLAPIITATITIPGSPTYTPTATKTKTVTKSQSQIPTPKPKGPLCPTPSSLTVLNDLPSEALRQYADSDVTCNLWVIACQKDLPCGEFVRQVRQLIPDFTINKFFNWNPNVQNDQGCSGFWQNYTYCVGQTGAVPRDLTSNESPLNDESKKINFTSVNRLNDGFDVGFNRVQEFIKSAYEMSPFIAWSRNASVNASNPSAWPGIDTVTKDLSSLLANTNTTIPSDTIFGSLKVSSPDWSLLSLDECLGTFSIRYRPYAGTVVLVVSGGGSGESENFVLGFNYLSYLTQSLGVVCPDYFIDKEPGGPEVKGIEDPPTLPLIFGTFGEETSNKMLQGLRFQKGDLCPHSYGGVRDYSPKDIPKVEGCLLRVRGSKCRLGYNVIFFMIVTAALMAKLVLLLLAIHVVRERPILTIGDAIAGYLECEDPSTIGCSIEWTKDHGLQCTGPMRTYDAQPTTSGTAGGHLNIPGTKSFRRRWREIWPSKGDARSSAVPKWDIINYSATMKSWETAWWLILYISTLAVCAGIFTSIFLQSGWMVYPAAARDKYWMLWPCVLVNLPQLFATFRSFADTKILTSRNTLQEFAQYATAPQGLRVSSAYPGSAQRDPYFFGNMNGLVYITMTGLQILYTFIISQLVVPQWINPLNPGDDDAYFSPAFLMRFGSQEKRPWIKTACIIALINIFPLIGVHIINTMSSFVVRVRLLKISELSTFIPQYLFDMFFIPSKLRPGKGDLIETTHLLPLIPLQMPGPATNSLVLSVACHPKSSEQGTQMSRKPLQWGVVYRPSSTSSQTNSQPIPQSEIMNQNETISSPAEVRGTWEQASLSAHQIGGTLRREFTTITTRRAPRYSQIMEVPEEGVEDDFITFSPTSPEGQPFSPTEKTPFVNVNLTQIPEETVRRSSTTNSTFSIKRKALPFVQVMEVQRESTETLSSGEGKDVGHCSFSAEPVDELEPGKLYTGIRSDENYMEWLKSGGGGLKRSIKELVYRLRPRRNVRNGNGGHYNSMGG